MEQSAWSEEIRKIMEEPSWEERQREKAAVRLARHRAQCAAIGHCWIGREIGQRQCSWCHASEGEADSAQGTSDR